MNTPKHLKHKPIVSINDYDKVDGKYAGKSDAKALSIGVAQYDKDEISAKIWRHTSGKWSRQSEEMPLHRVLDLSKLIVDSILLAKGSIKPKATLSNNDNLPDIENYYNNNKQHLDQRLKDLRDAINQLIP
jgi:hypothetical protein